MSTCPYLWLHRSSYCRENRYLEHDFYLSVKNSVAFASKLWPMPCERLNSSALLGDLVGVSFRNPIKLPFLPFGGVLINFPFFIADLGLIEGVPIDEFIFVEYFLFKNN